MKNALILVTLFLTLTPLAAEEIRRESNFEAEFAHALQLTPAQQSTWETARADFRTATRPLFTRSGELGQQIETVLKEKSADACTLGNLLIAHQAINDQIRSARETMIQKFQSVLTPDQKSKFEAIQATRTFNREHD